MTERNALDLATGFISRGLRVTPPARHGKTPVASWKEYQTRRATAGELRKWSGNGSACNIGIVAGPVSIRAVVDIDNESAFNHVQETIDLNTPLVRTGKGYHAYFKYREGLRNSREELPGVHATVEEFPTRDRTVRELLESSGEHRLTAVTAGHNKRLCSINPDFTRNILMMAPEDTSAGAEL